MRSVFEILVVIAILLNAVHSEEQLLQNGEVRMGSYGYKCVSDCEMRDGTNYYWCDAEHPTKHYKGDYYWDYCSRYEDHDYKGVRCYIEHACGNHGYRYKWCYTSEDRSSWGYCGYKVNTNLTKNN